MRVVLFCVLLATSATTNAEEVSSTCTHWFEPKTAHDAMAAKPDNNDPAVIFGKRTRVGEMHIRFMDSATGRRLEVEHVKINYAWRWLEYPYPEHSWGAWSDTADQLTCQPDVEGWIETPIHEVQPRGWYNGKYTRWPWQHAPSFTGVELVALTERGLDARVELKPGELAKFKSSNLIVTVSDGWRTATRWEKRK